MSVRFSRQGRVRLFLALVLFTVAIAGGGYWYFCRYTKTPTYALQRIETAVQKKDADTFLRYVDVDALTARASTDVLTVMLAGDRAMNDHTRSAMANLSTMFQSPLQSSLRNMLLTFVKTGAWDGAQDANGSSTSIDATVIMKKTGLDAIEWHGFDAIRISETGTDADFDARVYQTEAAAEFTLRVHMTKSERGAWQCTEIANFDEFLKFVMAARKTQRDQYLTETAAIVERHESAVKAIDQKLLTIARRGNLGDAVTRQSLKRVVTEELLPDWQARQAALTAIEAPASAQSLHRLRLRICDVEIRYAEAYAEWLDTKAPETIRHANTLLQEAKTLEREATVLRQMQGRY